MDTSRNLLLLWLKIGKFDDVTASELINATILKVIRRSQIAMADLEQITHPKFLSRTLIQSKM